MAIQVKALENNFRVQISSDEDKVICTFKQLTYKTKSLITSLVTSVKQGSYSLDLTMQMFYNIKYALKNIEGIEDVEGSPYKLEFEDDGSKFCLTDKCVDELLATVFSDQLQYTARQLNDHVLPTAIVSPLTLQPIEGIEILPSEGIKKK